jgi:hypothetical protein
MALDAGAIATGIAALSISGVTVKDITEMPEKVNPPDCPVLIPGPVWITGGTGSNEGDPATFGPGMWVMQRGFAYRYFHAPVGSGRGLYDHYADMADKLDAIQTAFTTLALAGVDVMGIECSEFGMVGDPADNRFYGFDIAVSLKERINA